MHRSGRCHHGIGAALVPLGHLARFAGPSAQAKAPQVESLTLGDQGGGHKASYLGPSAELETSSRSQRKAARLFGAIDARSRRVGAALRPCFQRSFDAALIDVRSALGDEAVDQSYAEGQASSLEQAVEHTLKG